MSKVKIVFGLCLLFCLVVLALAVEKALPSNDQAPSVVEEEAPVALPETAPSGSEIVVPIPHNFCITPRFGLLLGAISFLVLFLLFHLFSGF